jgi:magnesium transporter
MHTANIQDLLDRGDWLALRQALGGLEPPELADRLLELDKPNRSLFYRVLPRDVAADVFALLTPESQDALLRELADDETRELLRNLSPDDRTHLLEELPGQVTSELLRLLSPEDLREARFLLGYPEESVGRLMTPDYVAIRPEWTIGRALEEIRTRGRDSETINRIYVIDAQAHLIDDIELRRVILADPAAGVDQVLDRTFVSISAFADREEAVTLIRRYDLVALPVVDSQGVLVGIVTVDDVLDVAVEEATEDFHRVASVEPIRTSLRDAGIAMLYRRRIVWLLALVFMNIFSGAGIAYFEDTIAAAVALVFFLPLLIDSGGNAGSQAATLMVRALATGDVRMRDWFSLLGKELAVATAMGLTMAGAVYLVGMARAPDVALVVATTMTIVVIVGSLIGMSLPFVFTRLGWDPATASAPLITSLADISGVLIYFSVATWYLGLDAPRA